MEEIAPARVDFFTTIAEHQLKCTPDYTSLFPTAGAHSHSMGFQYNGKLRAPELLLRSDGVRVDLVRARESLHCLYDNTVMPADLERTSSSEKSADLERGSHTSIFRDSALFGGASLSPSSSNGHAATATPAGASASAAAAADASHSGSDGGRTLQLVNNTPIAASSADDSGTSSSTRSEIHAVDAGALGPAAVPKFPYNGLRKGAAGGGDNGRAAVARLTFAALAETIKHLGNPPL